MAPNKPSKFNFATLWQNFLVPFLNLVPCFYSRFVTIQVSKFRGHGPAVNKQWARGLRALAISLNCVLSVPPGIVQPFGENNGQSAKIVCLRSLPIDFRSVTTISGRAGHPPASAHCHESFITETRGANESAFFRGQYLEKEQNWRMSWFMGGCYGLGKTEPVESVIYASIEHNASIRSDVKTAQKWWYHFFYLPAASSSCKWMLAPPAKAPTALFWSKFYSLPVANGYIWPHPV